MTEYPAQPSSAVPATEIAALVALCEQAARRAGTLTVAERLAEVGVAATKSSPTDVVTEMDRRVEALLREIVAAARPDDARFGEEAGREAGRSGLTWVFDPIDGTVNYLYGLGMYAVSVAVVLGDPELDGGWEPLAGCVHNPVSGQTWTAGRGAGAFLDGRRIRVPAPPGLSTALTGTGFGYLVSRRRRQARVAAGLLPRVRDLRRMGCAAIDLCLVATGRLDAFYESGLHSWDIAAARLVVEEAGAVLRGISGRPAGESMVVAAARPLVDDLAAVLEELGAGQDEPAEPNAGQA